MDQGVSGVRVQEETLGEEGEGEGRANTTPSAEGKGQRAKARGEDSEAERMETRGEGTGQKKRWEYGVSSSVRTQDFWNNQTTGRTRRRLDNAQCSGQWTVDCGQWTRDIGRGVPVGLCIHTHGPW